MKTSLRILLTIGIMMSAVLLAGCNHLLPTENTEKQAAQSAEHIQATHETELTKKVDGNSPPISVSQTGTNNTASITVQPQPSQISIKDSSGSATIASKQQSESSITSIPLGVKLIMLGLGLALIAFVVKSIFTYVKANSAAVAAAYNYGDQSLANVIGHLESKRASATDPAVQANLNDLLAVTEKERGKLNAD